MQFRKWSMGAVSEIEVNSKLGSPQQWWNILKINFYNCVLLCDISMLLQSDKHACQTSWHEITTMPPLSFFLTGFSPLKFFNKYLLDSGIRGLASFLRDTIKGYLMRHKTNSLLTMFAHWYAHLYFWIIKRNKQTWKDVVVHAPSCKDHRACTEHV